MNFVNRKIGLFLYNTNTYKGNSDDNNHIKNAVTVTVKCKSGDYDDDTCEVEKITLMRMLLIVHGAFIIPPTLHLPRCSKTAAQDLHQDGHKLL